MCEGEEAEQDGPGSGQPAGIGLHPRRQAGGVIGWTSAIAAFGPFLFGVGLTLMSPTTFYLIGIAWAVMCVGITWWRYARPGAEKKS